MPLTPTPRNVPLATRISQQLRDEIRSGDWPVGSRIPGEHQLVETFGASRNTVREAIRGLVHAGLLEARPGDGTYVRAASELEVALQRRASVEAAIDVFEVREALEIHAARLAAERAGRADVERLRDLLAARDADPEPAAHIATDLRFHAAVVEIAGNTLLTDMHRHLDRGSTYRPHGATDEDLTRFLIASWGDDDPHRALVEAIARRDPDAAATATLRILRHAREAFLRTVPQP
ncbi:FadR/GntR family transcriptional regulator [Nocardioides sp. DS6]|uniref:FadR/GntR family transcriptional regulator n=1 Tax=Nocardioides eburneus TaxID=3231482 RepID=A0ABV3T275_9ACTN